LAVVAVLAMVAVAVVPVVAAATPGNPRGDRPMTLEEAVNKAHAALEQAWKRMPNSQGSGPTPSGSVGAWKMAIAPLIPASWPPDGSTYLYAYARRLDFQLRDGERTADLWARACIAQSGEVTVELLAKQTTELGIQGVRPVVMEEMERHFENGRRVQSGLLSARQASDVDRTLAKEYYARWKQWNGVIAERIAARHKAFFAAIGCIEGGKR
jgi:hypothetical protein